MRGLVDSPGFAAEARRLSLRVARVWLLCLLALALPCWSLDALIYRGLDVLLASLTWRAAITVLLAGLCALLWRGNERWVLRNLHTLALLAAALGGLIVGAGQGAMGGLARPSFAGLYLLPFIGVVFTGPLRVRAASTFALLSSALAGALWACPADLQHPHIGMVFGLLGFAGATAVGIGHAITLLLARNFEQARLLAARSTSLEEQVAERTRELRELADHIDGAREDERQRIARELHDDLGGLLTLLSFELASRGRAREYLEQASASLRSVVLDLRPPALDSGLVAAFGWLCERHEEATGTACVWSVELDERRVDRTTRTALFRLLQEALTNAARHARATTICVELRATDGGLCLAVTDDGVGFCTAEVASARFGLLGMRERARRLGGSATIDSRPGHGTHITIDLPLAAREEAA